MIIKVKIQGRTPLLIHAFNDAAAEAATNGTRLTTQCDRGTPREQCEAVLYKSAQDDSPVIPQPNIFRCLIDAGKFHKAGRSKVTTQKSSLIPAAISLDEVEYPIIHKDDWKVDTRAVRIPATGGRILRHRPCFDDWALEFEVSLDEEMMTEKTFRAIVDDAGRKIGLGDFRPDTKGPFGKFDVVLWEPQKD